MNTLHNPSDKAAERGEPSYVWRSGQERRLQMLAAQTTLHGCRFLDAGGGNGLYAAQVQERFGAEAWAFDIEYPRIQEARRIGLARSVVAQGEFLPYPAGYFDVVFSNEVIEHVADDAQTVAEMLRVLRVGGRLAIFCPNRWYPVEQHGHYWQGEYHFGNTPLINYLPDRWRNQLAPHVRTYTARKLHRLFDGHPIKIVHHTRIFGGYDNIVLRRPTLGKWIRRILYPLEYTPLRVLALSHWLVVEKTSG
jgi:SAM-dependent methyltransferase